MIGDINNFGPESAWMREGEPVLPKNSHYCNNGKWGEDRTLSGNNLKIAFVRSGTDNSRAAKGMTYNFSTKTWATGSGEQYDTNGNLVE